MLRQQRIRKLRREIVLDIEPEIVREMVLPGTRKVLLVMLEQMV